MKILHIIPDLAVGGAEMMLYKLLSHPRGSGFYEKVITIKNSNSSLRDNITDLGVEVNSCHIAGYSFRGLLKLRTLLGEIQVFRPDLIQGWLYHGNILSLLAVWAAFSEVPVIWNIRHSLDDLMNENKSIRFLIRLNRFFSKYAQEIIYNSEVSKLQHESYGFSPKNSSIIPNGIDTQAFTMNADKGFRIRSELNIPGSAMVVGHIARYHPIKNHRLFLEAAIHLLNNYPGLHFILAGSGITESNIDLKGVIPEKSLAQFHFLGERQDIPAILNSLDLFCLSSSGEAWPNVLGEALACGVPCLATDVGDSKTIVDQYGLIVPPGDREQLTRGLAQMISLPRARLRAMGRQGRKHIESNFELRDIVRQYHALYEGVLAA